MLARIYGYDTPGELIATISDINHQINEQPAGGMNLSVSSRKMASSPSSSRRFSAIQMHHPGSCGNLRLELGMKPFSWMRRDKFIPPARLLVNLMIDVADGG